MNTDDTVKNMNETEDEVVLASLRAQNWDEFYGQKGIKRSLGIAISAAKKRKETLEHVLLYGPPGLGKTTLSHIIAREMGVNIRVTSGPAIERAGDLASILTNLQEGDVLFIDEVHRLNKVVEETLYPAMEDFVLDIIIGKGPSAQTLRMDLPRFTIVGATTKAGSISAPLRDRFGVINRLEYYSPDELAVILTNAAKKLNIGIDEEATFELAKRARGTPRIALRLLKRARDFSSVKDMEMITHASTNEALKMLEIDALGLDNQDMRYLDTLIKKFDGGPAGLETMAASLSEDVATLEDVVEPYLLQTGFIKRTPRGRIATKIAYQHLGHIYPEKDPLQQELL